MLQMLRFRLVESPAKSTQSAGVAAGWYRQVRDAGALSAPKGMKDILGWSGKVGSASSSKCHTWMEPVVSAAARSCPLVEKVRAVTDAEGEGRGSSKPASASSAGSPSFTGSLGTSKMHSLLLAAAARIWDVAGCHATLGSPLGSGNWLRRYRASWGSPE